MADLAGRIMTCVAAHPSGTPGTRTLARTWLREHGWELPDAAEVPTNLDSLVDEAIRSSGSITAWLDSAEGPDADGAARQPWYARWTVGN
jgi:hypothetical protein